MRKREKLYKKAHNIKKNNLAAIYRHAKVTLRDNVCEKIIKKFHAFQAFRTRERVRADRKRRGKNRLVDNQ